MTEALKALMLKRSIDLKEQELKALDDETKQLDDESSKIEEAINEATTEEEQEAVMAEIDKLDKAREGVDEKRSALTVNIEELRSKLKEAETKAPAQAKKTEAEASETRSVNRTEVNTDMTNFNIRALPLHTKAFKALPEAQRSAIMGKETTKQFIESIRSLKGETRSISGADLTVPVDILEIVSENIYRYGKLLNHVNVQEVKGTARKTVVGTVPMAVWTEMCASIEELEFAFSQVRVDGYKLAGFIPVCNDVLKDSDIDLLATITEMLSQAVAKALDHAILYGKGSAGKQPLGILTRLKQTTKPEGYDVTAPKWNDLHTSNVIKIDGAQDANKFWSAISDADAQASTAYAEGGKVWCMNSKTRAKLRSKLISFNAEGALVAGSTEDMPIVGGKIETLDFMPDGDIIGGYGELYLIARRDGLSIESSRDVQFVQDNTVVKITERADGLPVIAEGFVAMNINKKEPEIVEPLVKKVEKNSGK